MFQKALLARPGIGPSVPSISLTKAARQSRVEPPAPTRSAASAALSAEDDFELGSEFLDVFSRASERVAGFVVGCSTVIGIAWLAFSLL